jgi:hypothetical protein
MKKIPLLIAVVMLLSFFASCEKENMDTFGNYYIYMSKDTSFAKMKDTLRIVSGDTVRKDSTLRTIGVYRSGVSASYPAMSVTIKVDSAYMDSMLAIYNNTTISNALKSDKVLYFKNSVILPADCYTLNRTVSFADGALSAAVPVQFNLKKLAKLNLTKSYVLPIALVSTTRDTIKLSKKRTMLRIKPELVYKVQNP